jgi:sugar/nucleoside kinase (ribokinase family)
MQGKPIAEAMKWGTVNSASVLGFVGPQAGLLNPEKLQEWLSKSPEIVAKEI